MVEIQYYLRPEIAAVYDLCPHPIISGKYLLDEPIESYRERFDSPKHGPPGTLFDTTGNEYVYLETRYWLYRAVIDSMLPEMRHNMRISSVGVAVLTRDKKVLVHRRGNDMEQYPGKLDSSAAGIMHIVDSRLDPRAEIKEKLRRELGITDDQIQYLGLSCVHHASDPKAMSGMYGFVVGVTSEPSELIEQVNPHYISEAELIKRDDLPDFVSEKFGTHELIGDGAAVLLASLPYNVFIDTVKKINRRTRHKVAFGKLQRGIFIEEII